MSRLTVVAGVAALSCLVTGGVFALLGVHLQHSTDPKIVGVIAVRQCDALRALVVENEQGCISRSRESDNPAAEGSGDERLDREVQADADHASLRSPDDNVTDGNGEAPTAVPPKHPSLQGQKEITTRL